VKITRKTLLTIIAVLALLIIAYTLVRRFTSFGLEEKQEKLIMDMIIIAALGLFVFNRKLAKDEQRSRRQQAEDQEAAECADPPEKTVQEDENLPHWEREKNQP